MRRALYGRRQSNPMHAGIWPHGYRSVCKTDVKPLFADDLGQSVAAAPMAAARRSRVRIREPVLRRSRQRGGGLALGVSRC